jgi:FlaA1/EpsC-like NDP-sugar epimerase
VAADLFERGLCLPSGTQMTDTDVTRVVEGVLAVRRRASGARQVAPAGTTEAAASRAPEPAVPLPVGAAHRQRLPDRPAERRSLRSRLLRRQTSIAVDLLAMASAFVLAYQLRFDFDVPLRWRFIAATQLPLVLAVQLTALYASGVLSFVWKYVGMAEVPAFTRAAVGSATVLLGFRFLLPEPLTDLRIPIRIILLDTVLAFVGLLALRIARRALWEREVSRRRAVAAGVRRRMPVLLVGAGDAGIMAVREIRSRGEQDMEIRGFVDDDLAKKGATISGIRVLGSTEDLPKLVPALGIEQVIVTLTDATEEETRRILSIGQAIPVRMQMVPTLYDLLQGRTSLNGPSA